MQDGRVVQVGSPRDIYERPATRFVADFVGSTNFIAGSAMADGRDELARISTPFGDMTVRCSEAPRRDDSDRDMRAPARPVRAGRHRHHHR